MRWHFPAALAFALLLLASMMFPASLRADDAPYTVLQETADRLIVQMPNRLIIVVEEVRAAPVVSAQVWVKTGSIYEQEHVGAGLSHFLEHLLAGGATTNRSEEETNAILGRIGAQTNAFTSLDAVAYYINTTSEHAPIAIELLSDWMQHSTIPQEQYERERQVIQREFEFGMGSSARIFWKLTQSALYEAHPARHPTIGYIDEFLTVTRDEIYDFYKRMYVPNNMLFIVAGDVDKKKTVEQIVSLWKNTGEGELPTVSFPQEHEIVEPRSAEGVAAIDRPQVRLVWPSVRLTEPGDYELDVLATILGDGESSRLVRTVRDEQGLVNTIDAYHSSASWGRGFFGVDFEVAVATGADEATQRQAIDAATRAILAQLEAVQKDGVTAEELARARRKTLVRTVLGAEAAQDIADRTARDIFAVGDPDYLERYAAALDKVTAEQVRDAARKFVQPQRQITVTLMPATPDNPPTEFARPDELNDARKLDFVPLDNAFLIAALEQALEGDAAKEKPVVVEEPKKYVLPNGMRLVVGRNTAVPAVSIHLYQIGGLLADAPGREGIANATALMQVKGTRHRSAAEIAKTIDDFGASLVTGGGANSTFAQAVGLSENFPALLELVADVTLNPTFPDDEWQGMQRRLVAAIDRQKDSWYGELSMRFRHAYYTNHPWSNTPMGSRDVIAALDTDDLRSFHASNLAASQTVLAVFGDVEPDKVYEQVKKLFGKMPSFAEERFSAPLPATPRPQIVNESSNKPLAAVLVGFGPGVERSHPDYASLRVLAAVMSSFPSGWLEDQLRGQGPGLVYAVGAMPSTGIVPGHFALLFNTNPKMVGEALSRSMSVVERARGELVSEEDLARAKAAVLTDEFFSQQTNSDRAAAAALELLYGLGVDSDERFMAAVKAIDAQTLRVIARTYLRNPIVIVLSPETVPTETIEKAMGAAATPAR